MKKYIWLTGLLLIALLVAGGFVVSDITDAQYAGALPAAQTALDNTVMNKVEDAVPYTGGMNGFVFTGQDKLGRELYVWTENQQPVAMTYASDGLSREKAIAAAEKPVLAKTVVDSMKNVQPQSVVDVIHATPGPILPRMYSDPSKTEFRTAESHYVWEIYGKLADGRYGYTYLDFKSGQVVWQYALDPAK